MSGWPEDLPRTFCDLCGKPHRVDLSGVRCNRCVVSHGRPDAPRNTHLVRVEVPSVGFRIDDSHYGWQSK